MYNKDLEIAIAIHQFIKKAALAALYTPSNWTEDISPLLRYQIVIEALERTAAELTAVLKVFESKLEEL